MATPQRDLPTHDDYVAGTSFGSWAYLLPRPNAGNKNHRVILWNETFSTHFHKNRDQIYIWVRALVFARNRASHLEPVHKEDDLMKVHRTAIRLTNAFNPAGASWIAGQAIIPNLIKQKSS